MDATTLNTTGLTRIAIDALKNAFDESTNTQVRQSIATAYTAITLLKFEFDFGNSEEHGGDIYGDYDPSEYCAAI